MKGNRIASLGGNTGSSHVGLHESVFPLHRSLPTLVPRLELLMILVARDCCIQNCLEDFFLLPGRLLGYAFVSRKLAVSRSLHPDSDVIRGFCSCHSDVATFADMLKVVV